MDPPQIQPFFPLYMGHTQVKKHTFGTLKRNALLYVVFDS